MEFENGVEDKEGIFKGCSEIVSEFLGPGIESLNQLKQKTTYRGLKDHGKTEEDFKMLLQKLYEKIEANRTERKPSKENWRMKRQTFVSDCNRSDEVLLERAIAILGEREILPGWTNQVPVASGLVDSSADKRAAVDLVRLENQHADLIELKWESDTPAFAAFEILLYGLVYLFCYLKRDDLKYGSRELMKVETISLYVLAPNEFYCGGDLAWLERGLSVALNSFSSDQTNGSLTMEFGFLSFPERFTLPFGKGKQVASLENLPEEHGMIQSLVSAVSGRHAVW